MNYQEYKDAITTATTALEAAKKKVMETKKDALGEAQKELETAKSNVKTKEAALEKFKSFMTKDQKQQINEYEKKLSNITSDISKLKRDQPKINVQEINKLKAKLKGEFNPTMEEISEDANKKIELKEAKSTLKANEKEKKKLDSKLEKATKKENKENEKHTELQSKLVNLKAKETNPEIDKLKKKLEKITEELKTASTDKKPALEAEQTSLQANLNGKKRIFEENKKIKIGNLEKQLGLAAKSLESATYEREGLENQIKGIESKITGQKETISRLDPQPPSAPPPSPPSSTTEAFKAGFASGIRFFSKDPKTKQLEAKIGNAAKDLASYRNLSSSKKTSVIRKVRKNIENKKGSEATANMDAAAAIQEEVEKVIKKEFTRTVTLRHGEFNFQHRGWTSVTLAEKSIFDQTKSSSEISSTSGDIDLKTKISKLNEKYGTDKPGDKLAFSSKEENGTTKISTGRMDREAGKEMAKMLEPSVKDGKPQPIEFRSGDSNSGVEFLEGAGKQCILQGKPCNLQTHKASSRRNNALEILNKISQIDVSTMGVGSDPSAPTPDQQAIERLSKFIEDQANDGSKKYPPKEAARMIVNIAADVKGGASAIAKVQPTSELGQAIKAELRRTVFKGNRIQDTQLTLQDGKKSILDSKKGRFFRGGNAKRAFMIAAKAMDAPGAKIAADFKNNGISFDDFKSGLGIKSDLDQSPIVNSDQFFQKELAEQPVGGDRNIGAKVAEKLTKEGSIAIETSSLTLENKGTTAPTPSNPSSR